MTLPTDVDLDDTHRCPRGIVCQSCGYETSHPTVTTVTTMLGVYCVTVCPRDLREGNPPPAIAASSVVRLVLAHCEHLGIDPDDMADILATEAASQPARNGHAL